MVAVIYFLISYPAAKLVELVDTRLDITRRRPLAQGTRQQDATTKQEVRA
jgi:hypothetical protein